MSDADSSDPTKPGDGIPDKYQRTVTYTVQNGTWNEDAIGFFTKKGTDLVRVYNLYARPENGNRAMEESQLTKLNPTLEKIPESTASTGYRGGSWSGTTPTAETLVTADVTYTCSYTGYYTTEVSYYKLNSDGTYEEWEGKEAVSAKHDLDQGYTCDSPVGTLSEGDDTYVLYKVEGDLTSAIMPAGTQPGDTIEIKAVYAKASSADESGNPVPDYLPQP